MKKLLTSACLLGLFMPSLAMAEVDKQDTTNEAKIEQTSEEKLETESSQSGNISESTTEAMTFKMRSQTPRISKKPTSFNTVAKLSQPYPTYKGQASIVVNHNQPNFSKHDLSTTSFEHYSNLDSLGRVQAATANLTHKMAGTGERESLSNVTPTGFHSIKLKNNQYLYHRTHLIGYQLSGEQANAKNLMTGTNDLNLSGMKPYEDKISDYLTKYPTRHVLYRVTPRFVGNEKVARGVQMEAQSVEDKGRGIKFNVYAFNNEPGVAINYKTGELKGTDSSKKKTPKPKDESVETSKHRPIPGPILANPNSMIYHAPDCRHYQKMNDHNSGTLFESDLKAEESQFRPCKDLLEKYGIKTDTTTSESIPPVPDSAPSSKDVIVTEATSTPKEVVVTKATEDTAEDLNMTSLPETGTHEQVLLTSMGLLFVITSGSALYYTWRRHHA